MPRIRPLEPLTINQIAAGEVIERPASVVKELLENSLDALATRVEVDVQQGGTELIRIVDDGEGIHPDDVALAVASHATSKLAEPDDLFRVRTLGFRGEALASIASISRLRIRTRTAEFETGVQLDVEAGAVRPPQSCGCPVGTGVEVRQLFLNAPVRRKFLKSIATEFGHVSEQFTRIAIAHPRLHAVLRHNDRPVFELPAADDLRDRLRLCFGGELVDQLIPVESELDGIRLWGYVGHPSQSKSTRKSQHLFLNGRWIQDRTLQHALGEAYRGLLMVGRYPIAFLFLEMPPDQVDVNVHPTKAEVRFRDGQQLYRQVLSAVRTKFLGMNLDSGLRVPAGSRAESGPASEYDEEDRQALQLELAVWAKDQLAAWTPPEPSPSSIDDARPHFDPAGIPPFQPFPGPADRFGAFDAAARSAFASASSPAALAAIESLADAATVAEFVEPADESSPSDWQADTVPAFAAHPSSPDVPPPHGPTLRAMQIHDCYLVVETAEGLTVIDQHALHERIMYEQLRKRVLSGAVETQRLLIPETIELPPKERALLLEHRELLSRLGFEIDDFGGQTLVLSSAPVLVRRADPLRVLRDLAERLDASEQAPTRRDLLDDLLHMMACKAAIKAGQRLSPEEMEGLLAQRHLVDDAHHCPHGRPTALVLSRSDLDRQFGRLGS